MNTDFGSHVPEIVSSYDDITLFFDGYYMPEGFDSEPTVEEFNNAHEVAAKHLNQVGKASLNSSDYDSVDFSLSSYFEPARAFNVVSDLHSPAVIRALIAAQKELAGEFAINLDSHPAYVSVLPDGRVIGYADDDDEESLREGRQILRDNGFLADKPGEQDEALKP